MHTQTLFDHRTSCTQDFEIYPGNRETIAGVDTDLIAGIAIITQYIDFIDNCEVK
jgi:hypothetical protein